jgi:hypothetical protein
VVTAEPQGELSHLAIRTARRNAPNAFVRGAIERFGAHEGRLVKLEVGEADYAVVEVADQREAEAFWEAHRPRLSTPPVLDADHAALDSLAEMDLDGPPPPEARYGGKASNLARLQGVIEARYGERGFAIPMRYYLEFLRTNRIGSSVVPDLEVTYEEYLRELFANPTFQSDPEYRFLVLQQFRDIARASGAVDPALVARLRQRIEAVFSSPAGMVRFRSSSNVEDALEFNGAGLYESTSTCALDLEGDAHLGPSRCNAAEREERTIERALKKVWTSLYTFRAFEEREFYGIPRDLTAMGILVTRAFLDERVNGVAFTGNPSRPSDRRYVVVAQLGDEANVVSPPPGILPEKNLLEVRPEDGVVTGIRRAQRSSLAAEGAVVLGDDELRELGSVLWRIHTALPVDLGAHAREDVMFDVEFKIDAGGALAIKQARPFLVADSGPPPPTFGLVVPPGTEACGVWTDGRTPAQVYALKSRVVFRAGRLDLPTAADSFGVALIESVEVGPGRARAEPLGEGVFTVSSRRGTEPGTTVHGFAFEQAFTVGGKTFTLELEGLDFAVAAGAPGGSEIVLDQETLTWGLHLKGELSGEFASLIRYGSCTHEILPTYVTSVELEGGQRVELEERYREVTVGSAPADFVRARVVLGGEERSVADYWHLVYSARRHNEHVVAWALLEPPLTVGERRIRAVEIELEDFHRRPPLSPPAPVCAFLGDDFSVLERPAIRRYCRRPAGEACTGDFRRGDVDGDGAINVTDALVTANYLFLNGAPLSCPDAGDFDDLDGLQLADTLLILNFLFFGVDLSAPPGPFQCGPDPTPDALAPCVAGGC